MVSRTVLIVEDDPNDIFLLTRGLKKAKQELSLVAVADALKARGYLKGEGEYSDRLRHPLPCLILLDARVPGYDGFKLLEWLQRNSDFSQIPVIVLSGGLSPDETEKALSLGAKRVFSKTTDEEQNRELYEYLDQICRTQDVLEQESNTFKRFASAGNGPGQQQE